MVLNWRGQESGLGVEDQCTAHAYAAEALAGLGEHRSAAEHLERALQRVRGHTAGGDTDLEAPLLTNLAAIRTAEKDLEQAEALGSQVAPGRDEHMQE
jgi:hypothetical protein